MIFLPALLAVYYIVPAKYRSARNYVLLSFSVLFYAWGEPLFVFLILFSLLVTCFSSKSIARRSRIGLFIGVAANLLPLLVYKYIDFIIANINLIPGVEIPALNLPLPIGISFYTFQILTYIIDLYRGKVSLQKNPLYVALYIFLFPQLIAGPIVRYSTIENEIEHRVENWDSFSLGIRRFCFGLAKKVLIANQAGYVASTILSKDAERVGSGIMWLAVFAYAIQIYFDFSGYSDMAIGLGKMFGFHFLENFEHPYISKSITEFWRRWHISLSTFFRDYIYIPLGGSKVSAPRWLFNIMFVWFLTGMWHGPFWNYILWGIYYGILLILEKYVINKVFKHIPGFFRWVYTFVLTLFGWAIFMTETNNMGQLALVFQKLFFSVSVNASLSIKSLELQPQIPYVLIGFVLCFPWSEILKLKDKKSKLLDISGNIGAFALYLASFFFLISESFNPFIYFRF